MGAYATSSFPRTVGSLGWAVDKVYKTLTPYTYTTWIPFSQPRCRGSAQLRRKPSFVLCPRKPCLLASCARHLEFLETKTEKTLQLWNWRIIQQAEGKRRPKGLQDVVHGSMRGRRRTTAGRQQHAMFFLTSIFTLANCWQTLRGSFSAVSKPNFASKYSFESS